LTAVDRKTIPVISAQELGGEVHVACHDLCRPETCGDWIAEAEAKLGPIDVLINNAGVQVVGPTSSTDPARAEEAIRTDLLAPLRLTRAVLPAMLQRRAGTIVDVTSMVALAPTPGMTWYNAAKAGLAAASEALRGELRGTGVHGVTVYPGIIPTDLADKAIALYGHPKVLRWVPTGTTAGLAKRVRGDRPEAGARHLPRVVRDRPLVPGDHSLGDGPLLAAGTRGTAPASGDRIRRRLTCRRTCRPALRPPRRPHLRRRVPRGGARAGGQEARRPRRAHRGRGGGAREPGARRKGPANRTELTAAAVSLSRTLDPLSKAMPADWRR
jgi:NAD(P)-dependent dehydrogenase (short-subunit alcohol dehydrogenase family)